MRESFHHVLPFSVKTWTLEEARSTCSEKGGKVVALKSKEEKDFVGSLAHKFWVDARRDKETGLWYDFWPFYDVVFDVLIASCFYTFTGQGLGKDTDQNKGKDTDQTEEKYTDQSGGLDTDPDPSILQKQIQTAYDQIV